MITPSIEANNVREAIKELKALDATVLKAMRKAMGTLVTPAQLAGQR